MKKIKFSHLIKMLEDHDSWKLEDVGGSYIMKHCEGYWYHVPSNCVILYYEYELAYDPNPFTFFALFPFVIWNTVQVWARQRVEGRKK